LKTHSQKNGNQESRAAAHQTVQKNNSPVPAMMNVAPAQLEAYSKTVTRPAVFNKNNWPATLSAGGKDADGTIGSKANDVITALGWTGRCMSAHMIPKRIGGLGNTSNVRPWSTVFEGGTWETDVEDAFNTALDEAEEDDEVTYEVETTEMTDGEAETKLEEAGVGEDNVNYNKYKERLKKIPTAVSATIGGAGKGPYDGCMPAGRPAPVVVAT
jgi:hypothetical protein